jgi:hypothetical protein
VLRKSAYAVYAPNAPDSDQDLIESGKTTIGYNAVLSASVLDLFNVTFSGGSETYEIKGTVLPTFGGASNTNLIVIDVGIPEGNNSGVKWYIPDQGLGNSVDYSYIRFRVNKGAEVVILANNANYLASGAGNPCTPGNFNNGCIEVMAGGKLRDGAFEGFPLGSNAVILNRLGSYLAVGPEESTGEYNTSYNGITNSTILFYQGMLIGPQGSGARIEWDAGGRNDDYIEVILGQLAINANVTVKKTLGLIYSVWFVNGSRVTIDASGDAVTPNPGTPGLFANGATYKFWGNPGATIIVKSGSALDNVFLSSTTGLVSGPKEIINAGTGSLQAYGGTTTISGYSTWNDSNGTQL